MSWYGVRVIYEALLPDDPGGEPLFEDRILVVEGQNEAAVRSKAEELCRSDETTYKNEFGQQISWIFSEILDIREFVGNGPPKDGTEVYYMFQTRDDIDRLRQALGASDK